MQQSSIRINEQKLPSLRCCPIVPHFFYGKDTPEELKPEVAKVRAEGCALRTTMHQGASISVIVIVTVPIILGLFRLIFGSEPKRQVRNRKVRKDDEQEDEHGCVVKLL